MSTPVQRSAHLPAQPVAPPPPVEPVQVAAPIGWVVALIGATGLLFASWLVYPLDHEGMWAGYRASILGLVVLVAVMSLRTSLPARPAVGLIGLSGVLLVLSAVFLDEAQRIFVSELAAGIVLLIGAGLQAAGTPRD